jgi:putative ABC transport system permease protein
MNALAIAMRMLLREWKSGELGVLVLAITVACGTHRRRLPVDRISSGRQSGGRSVGGRSAPESPQPMDDKATAEAARRGLKIARSTGLLSGVQRRHEPTDCAARRVGGVSLAWQGDVVERSVGTPAPTTGNPGRGEVGPTALLRRSAQA